MSDKRKLGKGLSAIISVSPSPAEAAELAPADGAERITEVDIAFIQPNPNQPRESFDDASIRELASTIRTAGLLNPITLRRNEGKDSYSIVAGERRFRAVKLLGLKKIPARIIDADEERNFTIALIENIQRENLNPVEEAKAYKMLTEEFGLKQQEIAERVGRERASIANSMRLLGLPADILAALAAGDISQGHGKVLLSAPAALQKKLCSEVISKGLSVRALEELIKAGRSGAGSGTEKTKSAGRQRLKEAHIRKMEEKLRNRLGTKVEIKHSGKKGKIEISYFSLEDFDRIAEIIG